MNTFLISLLGGITSAMIGVAFFVVRERITGNREIIFSTLNDIEGLLDEVAEVSSNEWSAKKGTKKTRLPEISSLLHEIGALFEFVARKRIGTKYIYEDNFLEFRRFTSGRDLDVKKRPARPEAAIDIRRQLVLLKIDIKEMRYSLNQLF